MAAQEIFPAGHHPTLIQPIFINQYSCNRIELTAVGGDKKPWGRELNE
jgi:hypothetical protein